MKLLISLNKPPLHFKILYPRHLKQGHIMPLQYLYFSRKDYSVPRAAFKFPVGGFTVYCAETDKIYRYKTIADSQDYHLKLGHRLDLFPLTISIKSEKMLYFAYTGLASEIAGDIGSIIKNKSCFQKSLTDEEWARASRALARYKADPVGSLCWPVPETRREVDFSITSLVASAGGSAVTNLGILQQRTARPETPRKRADEKAARKLFERFNFGAGHTTPMVASEIIEEGQNTHNESSDTSRGPREINIAGPGEKPIWVLGPDSRKTMTVFDHGFHRK